jgi:GNAT superfamily N-acetyltransferase
MLIRPATSADTPRLNALIAESARALSAADYSPAQIDALVAHVFGVDSQLVADGTYYVIERDGALVACGGWSKRATLFGGDQAKAEADPLLDPRVDAARIRAFFVHPGAARQGLGRQLLTHCVAAARAAGFASLSLMATLPGERLYRALGFQATGSVEHELPGGVRVRFVPMSMQL